MSETTDRVKKIVVEHLGVDGLIDRRRELPLPRRGGLRHPAGARGRSWREDEPIDAQRAPTMARAMRLASRRAIRCVAAATRAATDASVQRRPITRRDRTREPSIATTSRGAPEHESPRTTTVRRERTRTRTRARANPRPKTTRARRPLADASRTTWPVAGVTCIRSASMRWPPRAAAGAQATISATATATAANLPRLSRRCGGTLFE